MLKIEIETHDRDLVFDLFPGGCQELALSGEVRLTDITLTERKAVNLPQIIDFFLDWGKQASAGAIGGVLATWLCRKLWGRRVETITIDKTKLELDKGRIRKFVRERIERHREV